jgi:hypothetical protein
MFMLFCGLIIVMIYFNCVPIYKFNIYKLNSQ